MAKELAHFKNFAKLKDTAVEFNDITVLAGKPRSGKSYVMKFHYAYHETLSSIISGAYKMHYALMDTDENLIRTFDLLKNLLPIETFPQIETFNKLIDDNNYIEAAKVFNAELEKGYQLEDYLQGFKKILDELSKKQINSLSINENEKFYFIFRNILESTFGSIDQIDDSFAYYNSKLAMKYEDNDIVIQSLNIEKVSDGALFVETPLILEFEKFLPSKRFKAPYHIDSLLQELNKKDFSFTSDETSQFINNFKKITSLIINGNISKGTQGFSFESNSGKHFNIVNASSGIKSIGLLQYLVVSKALKKGSILFWEEPEVHLHPEWQLRMIELFIELMNAGVKIVFSTHSPYMTDYLNALAHRRELRERVSFNLFKENDGEVQNHILETDEDWNMIQDELLGSLEDIMWQYL